MEHVLQLVLMDYFIMTRVEIVESVIQDVQLAQVSEIAQLVNQISIFFLSMTQDIHPVSHNVLLVSGSTILSAKDAIKIARVAMVHHNGNA